MHFAEQVRAEIIMRLKKRRVVFSHTSRYRFRYASQTPSERRTLHWKELIEELTLYAVQYGLETIDEQIFIEMEDASPAS